MPQKGSPTHESDAACGCTHCRNHHDFVLPEHLLEDFMTGKVAIFAGAGVSTESREVLRESLAESIAAELGGATKELAFPDLMQMYAQRPNGRFELIKAIKDRFDYIYSHPELHDSATGFHQELATMFAVDTIVTTNWDTNFEDECAATPFIQSEDVAFWDIAGRKVLKIHGTIQNYGSIIATRDDYNKATDALSQNMIGSLLKMLLATKTVVYFGYSLRDEDFLSLHSFVQSEMKELRRTSYIVTLDRDEESLARYRALGLIPIVTDGTYFLSNIKARMVERGMMFADTIYGEVVDLLGDVQAAHVQLYDELDMFDHPQIILCACYQDGLMHGLKRILRLRDSGVYSHPCKIFGTAEAYEKLKKEKVRARRYDDVAYIEGYQNALIYLAVLNDEGNDNPPPLYYAAGFDGIIRTFDDYKRLLNQMPKLHKAAYRYTKKIVDENAAHRGEGVVIHHHCAL